MELKDYFDEQERSLGRYVPNLPCGVERELFSTEISNFKRELFLICRGELKAVNGAVK